MFKKYFIAFFILAIGIALFNLKSVKNNSLYSADLALNYGRINDLKKRFVLEVNKHPKEEFDLVSTIETFNSKSSNTLSSSDDWIDEFLSLLPKNYRRHYTFLYHSPGLQAGSLTSPKVILYGPSAKTMMSFNAGVDLDGEEMAGGDSIEVIRWNSDKKIWMFSELVLDGSRINHIKEPANCINCHTGSLEAVSLEDSKYYEGKLKPIFTQYPLWPGVYGGLNDIIGLQGSSDKIGLDLKETKKHIAELTFGDHEELFKLRRELDTVDSEYEGFIEEEVDVHQNFFKAFIDNYKQRPRYKHLVSLKELYEDKGDRVPAYLESAPFRRNSNKEYGHYLLRPNFYLTSLMTFFQAEQVSREIMAFPEFDKFKYSLLASKYNCDTNNKIKVSGLGFADLEKTFELVYPNLRNEETMKRQSDLALKYNIINEKKNEGLPHVPLYYWNLEPAEEISSYHYGNVFADLNELVLWDLARIIFKDELSDKDDREGAEKRHYELRDSDYFKFYLNKAGGQRSAFSTSQQKFVESPQNYYGFESPKFKGLPVSRHCTLFLDKAKKELLSLSRLKELGQLPHQIYTVD